MNTVLSCDTCNSRPMIGTESKLKCECGGTYIVKGVENNWILLVSKYTGLIGNTYTNKGKEYTFFGLVHGYDDFYYGMCDNNHKVLLLSCTGDLETHGFIYNE